MTKKNRYFGALGRWYVRRRMRGNFSDVKIAGLDSVRAIAQEGAFILAPNHVAWWDPFLLVALEPALQADGYCLMDAKNLQQLPFFSWLGAIPLRRDRRREAYQDLLKASDLLDRPGRMLVIFPGGEQRPAHLPLSYKPGVATLAARAQVPVVPLAIRYDYLEAPKPVVHLSAGATLHPPRGTERRTWVEELERRTAQELARIDGQLLEPGDQFRSLLGRSHQDDEALRLPRSAAALRMLSGGSR